MESYRIEYNVTVGEGEYNGSITIQNTVMNRSVAREYAASDLLDRHACFGVDVNEIETEFRLVAR